MIPIYLSIPLEMFISEAWQLFHVCALIEATDIRIKKDNASLPNCKLSCAKCLTVLPAYCNLTEMHPVIVIYSSLMRGDVKIFRNVKHFYDS